MPVNRQNARFARRNHILPLVVLLFSCFASFHAQTTIVKNAETTTLRLNQPLERAVKGGETHSFQFNVKAGQIARAEVEQTNIDVVVSLLAPDGRLIVEMDGNFSYLWRESVSAIAEKGGIYKLQIKAKGTADDTGSYTVRLAELRKSAALDRKRIEAEQALIQAIRLSLENKLAESAKSYETSLNLWREIGDKYWEAMTMWNLAWAYFEADRNDEALKLLNQALLIYQELKDRIGESAALNGIGAVYRWTGKYELAREYLEKALISRKELKRLRSEYNTLNGLLLVYTMLNQPDKTLENLNRMLEISREIKDRKNERDTLRFFGLYYFQRLDFVKAQTYLEQTLEIDRELKDIAGELERLTNLGYVYGKLSQSEKAQKTFEQALEIAINSGDKKSESNVLSELGSFQVLTLEDFAKGRELLLRALDIKKELKNDKQGELVILGSLGVAFQGLGEYEKLIENSEKGLQLSKELNNKDYQIDFLESLGNSYGIVGQVDKAAGFYEEALTVARNEKLKLKEAIGLLQFASFYNSAQEYEKSRQLTEQAILIAKDLKNKRLINLALANLASTYSYLKQYEKAQSHYEQAVEGARETNDTQREAGNLESLGLLFARQSQFEKARSYFEQSYNIAAEKKYTYRQMSVLSSLGGLSANQSQFEQAVNYYEQALKLAEESKNILWQTSLYSSLGSTNLSLNRYEKAQNNLEKSLAIAKASKNIVYEAIAFISLGNMHYRLNQYEKARDYFEQVEKIAKTTKNRWLLGFATSGIGSVYTDLSNNLKAQNSYEQSLVLMKDVLDRIGEGSVLTSLGNTYLNLKEYDKAQRYYEESLTIAKQIKNKQSEVYPLISLGAVFQNKNELEKAQSFYEQGLSLAVEVKDRSSEGYALNGLGVVYFKLKKYREAEDFYRRSLLIAREVQSKKLEAIISHNLMELFRELKKPQIAIVYGKQAINIFQEIRGNIKGFDKESQQSYLKDKESAFRMLADLLISEGRLVEAQLILNLLKEEEYAQLARSGKKGDVIPYSRIEASVIAEIENLIALERERAELLALASRTEEQSKRAEELRLKINAANNVLNEELKKLAASDNSVADAVGKIEEGLKKQSLQSTLSRLRENTDSGVVAIYTVLGKEEKKGGKTGAKDEKTKFGWVILVTEKSYKAYPIDVTNFNETVLQFRDALGSDKYDPQFLAERLYNAIFRQKSARQKRTLEQDLREYLGAYRNKTIMWSLDGVLRYIPTAALHDGKNYLIENYRSVVLTDKNVASLETENKADWNVLGLGVSEQRENFEALPGVKIELETIVREKDSKTGILDGTIKLNENFKKLDFFSLISGGKYPVVHIATHYSFNPSQQTESFLLLGDGRLKFGEMEEDNLFGAVDLLTLSACETGVSGNGKEVEGFAYLAQSLGAKSVIASLWKVPDSGTPELMIRFYQLRKDNPQMPKGEAFRRAQLAMLGIEIKAGTEIPNKSRTDLIDADEKELDLPLFVKDDKKPFAHPHYWSSFVLIGNSR